MCRFPDTFPLRPDPRAETLVAVRGTVEPGSER